MVYVTGDMHGDFSRFDSPAIKQLKKGDTLIVCVDFGFVWDNSKIEQKILKKLGNKNFNEILHNLSEVKGKGFLLIFFT